MCKQFHNLPTALHMLNFVANYVSLVVDTLNKERKGLVSLVLISRVISDWKSLVRLQASLSQNSFSIVRSYLYTYTKKIYTSAYFCRKVLSMHQMKQKLHSIGSLNLIFISFFLEREINKCKSSLLNLLRKFSKIFIK